MHKTRKLLIFAVIILVGIALTAGAEAQEKMGFQGEELLPPNAKAGECYARVFVPPTYKTVSEQTLRKEASESLVIEDPRFETVEEEIMVKGPSERLEIIPAQYEWVEEKVLIYPEHTHLEEVPAVYETITEKVIDRPAHTVWKEGKGPIQRIDYSTGEIMCLVEIPATYKTITKRLLKTPATTREIFNAAKYTMVKRKVMMAPPTVRKIEIPAEYQAVKAKKMISPAKVERMSIPEEFQTVSRRELLTEGRMEWRSILCETNVRPGIVLSLQKALKEEGYNPGNIDGDLGRQTMTAIQSYQRDKGLPVGELTLETLKSLNVDF